MNILMMTNSYFPVVGGIERSIASFSEALRSQGHAVMIAAPAWEGQAPDEAYVIRLPAIKKFYHTEFSINVPLPGLIPKMIKTFTPDIIHSHHPFFLGDEALRMSRQYSIPLVFTYHIMFEKYIHYLPVQNEKAKRFIIELAGGYCNLVHQVIAPSQSVKRILQERGVVVPVEVLASGVDLNAFKQGDRHRARQRLGIDPEAFVVGYTGRLALEKNLDFWLRCLLRFVRQYPAVQVMIVGGGPMQEPIETAFLQAGLANRLHLTGILHGEELVDAYTAMDVFAFTSLSETQGMVLVEAMAAGVPVVALKATGVEDVVEDCVNGRLINEETIDDFLEALRWVKDLPICERQQLSLRAQATAHTYSTEACAKRLLSIYERLIGSELAFDENKDSAWQMLRHRMKAEWDLFKNLMEASEAAIHEKLTAS